MITVHWKRENMKNSSIASKIISIAFALVGEDFNPGLNEQCCYFVRKVFSLAGKELGVTTDPSDKTFPTDEGYANSLAGDDIGCKIDKISDLLPGDLVFFKNTYGNWPDGTITHVGIYCGNGEFIHRSTTSQPVEVQALDTYHDGTKFVEGRRVF
jgi:cell wall-associated NlpC family hydrolase